MIAEGGAAVAGRMRRFPSEWGAALTIVLVAGAIRVLLGPAALTPLAIAGLGPLVFIYCIMGRVLQLAPERRASLAGGSKRAALIASLVIAHLPFPLLLLKAYAAAGGSAISADRGLGIGLGGYVIALLEAGQLFFWLSVLVRSPRLDGGTARHTAA